MHIHLQAKKSKNEVWITHFIYTDPGFGGKNITFLSIFMQEQHDATG